MNTTRIPGRNSDMERANANPPILGIMMSVSRRFIVPLNDRAISKAWIPSWAGRTVYHIPSSARP